MGFDASTLQHVSTGLQTVGTVTATVGAYNKSLSEKYGYEYKSQIARQNAQVLDWQADDAKRRGDREEQNHRLRVAAFKGTQIAELAARGIDLGEGSALNILTSTDVMGERDALLIRDNAAKDVWGFREKARHSNENAEAFGRAAKSESPFMAAGTTLLTGAGAVAKSWYAMRTKTDLNGGYGSNAFGWGKV